MSVDKYLPFEKVRKKKQSERLAKEHLSKGDMKDFDELMGNMAYFGRSIKRLKKQIKHNPRDLAAAKGFWGKVLEMNPRNIQAKRNLDRLLEEHPELK